MSPKEDYSEKVVIITGSSSGIGQSAALLFAQAGASVTITGRSADGLKATSNLITAAGVPEERVHSVKGSIIELEVQKRLINETIEVFGRLDLLINNAGGINFDEPDQKSMESLDYILALNLKTPVSLTELAIPHLSKTKGNVINIGSCNAIKPWLELPYYAIAKAGLDHFARNYAAHLAPHGVRINNLNPGCTATPAMDSLGQDEAEKMKNYFKSLIPLRRLAKPEEMGEFLLFMGSDRAAYLTAQCICVDGGFLNNSPSIKVD